MGTLIASEILINRETLEEKKCMFWELESNSINEIMTLQENITSSMENKEYYVPLTHDEFEFILNDGGVVLGAYVDNEFIGMYALMFPGTKKNLGEEIGISGEDLSMVIHLESAFVVPTYRGNNLLLEMKKMAIKYAQGKRSFKYILATIHPDNFPSIQAHFSINLYIIKLQKMYNNLWRYILFKNTEESLLIDVPTIKEVNIKDKEEQIKLLSEGYIGYKQIRKENETFMCYAKKI